MSHHGATATAEHKTGVKDEVYNVVSVLYHAHRAVRLLCSISRMPKGWRSETSSFSKEVQECHQQLHSPRTYWAIPRHGMAMSLAVTWALVRSVRA